MPLFKYTALGPDGKEVSGLIEAEDELAAMSKVKADYQIVLKMTKTSEKAKARIDLNEPLWVSEKTRPHSLPFSCARACLQRAPWKSLPSKRPIS